MEKCTVSGELVRIGLACCDQDFSELLCLYRFLRIRAKAAYNIKHSNFRGADGEQSE